MKNLIYTLLVLFAFSCSTQNVAVDYDRGQDFSQLRDYTIEFTDNSLSELDLQRIQTAIQQELQSKGMSYNPQSAVKVSISPDEYLTKEHNSNINIGVGSGGRGFGTSMGMSIPVFSEKLNKRYVVSIFNDQQQMVWNSRLEISMPAKATAEVLDTHVKKGVQKLFKNYPPSK